MIGWLGGDAATDVVALDDAPADARPGQLLALLAPAAIPPRVLALAAERLAVEGLAS